MRKMEPQEEIQIVFDKAKEKFLSKMSKPGNVERPWETFRLGYLEHYLEQEVAEYTKSDPTDPEELLDVINVAAFLYLKRTKPIGNTSKSEG